MFGDSDKGNACLMSNLEHLVVICIAMSYFKLYCSYGLRIWKNSDCLMCVCVTQCQKENRFGDVIETISCFYRRKQQRTSIIKCPKEIVFQLVAFESHKSFLIRFDYILRDISRKQS